MDIKSKILNSNSFPDFSDDDMDLELSLIFSSDSSSSSSDSTVSENDNEKDPLLVNYLDTINTYNKNDFKKHFRMNRATVNQIIDLYKESIKNQQAGGRQSIGYEKEIYIFLWYMGNTHTFSEIANLFGISKSGAWNVIVKVSSWLISIGHNYIKWPTVNDIKNEMLSWEEKTKIPNVIGAISCFYIKIKAPQIDKTCYLNRKKYYSIHAQAVVDNNKKIIDIFVGAPGSLHYSRVLRRSELFNEARTKKEILFPNNAILIGDFEYPLLDWIIPPFEDNDNLTNVARQFNALHSSARIILENTFDILNTRFRRLLYFAEQTNIKLVVNLTVACCILHNFCINHNDHFEDELQETFVANTSIHEPVTNEFNEQEDFDQSNRRQNIIDYLIRKGVIIP